jgi:hypothetical protein
MQSQIPEGMKMPADGLIRQLSNSKPRVVVGKDGVIRPNCFAYPNHSYYLQRVVKSFNSEIWLKNQP